MVDAGPVDVEVELVAEEVGALDVLDVPSCRALVAPSTAAAGDVTTVVGSTAPNGPSAIDGAPASVRVATNAPPRRNEAGRRLRTPTWYQAIPLTTRRSTTAMRRRCSADFDLRSSTRGSLSSSKSVDKLVNRTTRDWG